MLITSLCFFRENIPYDLILTCKETIIILDIKAFIRELLFEHDCVIVPGFGGFIGNFSPSRVDERSGMFYPPVKQISFNRNLNHNDGLLISKISRSTGINYGDARYLVDEFVKEQTYKLAKGEKVVFDHIGIFVHNQESSILFEPEANINYHAGSYGLESFQWFPAREYDVRKRVTRHISKDPVRLSITRKNLWRAAVLIPVLALLIAVPLKTDRFKARVEATSLNPLVTAEFENNKKAIDEAVVIMPDSNTAVKPEIITAPVEEVRYSIIAGSFKSKENALSHVEDLKSDGYEPEIKQASNGFFRVTAMTCTSMEKALSTRDSISKKFPGTWISKE
jgi:hypothetical protein